MTVNEPDVITAPWDERTVKMLNRFQGLPWIHPFTCGKVEHSVAPRLIATVNGWRCAVGNCLYTQNWAHSFMADPNKWPHGPGPYLKLHGKIVPVGAYDTSKMEHWCCNGNAEECAHCDCGQLPYPWICPGGHEDTPLNRRKTLAGALPRGKEALHAAMKRLQAYDALKAVEAETPSCCEEPHETPEDEERCEAFRLAAAISREIIIHPRGDEQVPRLRVMTEIELWAQERDLAAALGSFGDGYRQAQADALAALSRDDLRAAETDEQPSADAYGLDLDAFRALASERLLKIALERTEREWICCDPVKVDHPLCVQGEATRQMLIALMTDDRESFPPSSDFLDEVVRLTLGHADPEWRANVLSTAEVKELYGKAIQHELVDGLNWSDERGQPHSVAEVSHRLLVAVMGVRDRELARTRQRLLLTDNEHRLAVVAEMPPIKDEAEIRREERLKVLNDVHVKIMSEIASPIEEIAFHNTLNWLRKVRKAEEKAKKD